MNKPASARLSLITLLGLSLLALAGCSTTAPQHGKKAPPKDGPETVLVTYHVKPGMEIVFEKMLTDAWNTYRKEQMVLGPTHIIVREPEVNNTTGYIEIFTWVNHAAPEKAPDSVKNIWSQEMNLCQPRNGQGGIGGGEVLQLVPPLR